MLSPTLLQHLSKFLGTSQAALTADFQGMLDAGTAENAGDDVNDFDWPDQLDQILSDTAAQLNATAAGEGWNIDGFEADEEGAHLWSTQSLLMQATAARNLFNRTLNRFQSSLAGQGGFTPFEMTDVRGEAMNVFDRLLTSALARRIVHLLRESPDDGASFESEPPSPTEKEPAEEEVHSLGGALLPENVQVKIPSEITAAALHDIRDGINAVGTLIGKLRAAVPAGRDEPAAQAVRRLQRMTTLLESLGVSGSMRAALPPLEPIRLAPLAVRSFMEALADAFRPLAEQKGLRFASNCDSGLTGVETDAPKLHRAASLLIGNAIHYTVQGGVSLLARSAGRDWTLTVEDTGPGIDPAKLGQLLTGQALGSDRIPHGIAVARELVALLGGRLDAESVMRRGCRFSICLPRTRILPPSASATQTP